MIVVVIREKKKHFPTCVSRDQRKTLPEQRWPLAKNGEKTEKQRDRNITISSFSTKINKWMNKEKKNK